jgi:glycosyltransferase involved in cell wall biosynthesis
MKILFLVAHRPGRSPGQRFRFEQYLDALRQNNCRCDISYLLNERDDVFFYSSGNYFQNLRIFLKTIRIRLRDLRKAKDYDIVFLYREAVMFGSAWFEKRLAKRSAKLILDYDDAIWLRDVSEGNRRLAWLKRPSKTADIIKVCDLIITGNEYLGAYARTFNRNVAVVPTTIETHLYQVPSKVVTSKVCIGWTGSITTLRHLEQAKPILQKIYERYGDKVCFRVIADREWTTSELPVEFVRWKRESEIEDLSVIDIGIMPLPDNDWARGKCGFKGLQYMALGIPAIMSPVGVNTEIITDGINGFLASGEQEWIEKLSLLIEAPELRKKLGTAGRTTVEERYSYNAWKDRYVQLFVKDRQ